MHRGNDTLGSAYSVDVSLSESVQGYARELATRVPFPVIFIVGAALGILLATVFVTFSHSTSEASATPTFSTAAPLVAPPPSQPALWAPLPVVTIHPAPPQAMPIPLAPPPAAPQRAMMRAPRKVVVAPVRRPASSSAHDLLASAL